MPHKSKYEKTRDKVLSLARESIKNVRDDHIQGDYVWLIFVSVVKYQ